MTLDPYAPPAISLHPMPKEVPTRQDLIALIEAYLGREISGMEADENLDEYFATDDSVIDFVASSVSSYINLNEDSLDYFSKAEWDYFQRLLLVLSSNCKIEQTSDTHWSFKQLIAAISLGTFIWFAVRAGWGPQLFLCAIPFGAISIALSFWRPPIINKTKNPYFAIIYPFATFSDLAKAYHGSKFQKKRYPKQLAKTRNDSCYAVWFALAYCYAAWLILAPIPLFFQMFPFMQKESRVLAV